MTRWTALLRMDLRALSREWWLWTSLVFTPLMGALIPMSSQVSAAFDAVLDMDDDDPVVLCIEGDPGLPSAAFEGQPPSWLTWPGGWTSVDEADVWIDQVPGHPPDFRVMALTSGADLEEADDCVWSAIYDERAERLEQLGVSERPGVTARVTFIAPAPEGGFTHPLDLPGVLLTGLLSVLMFGTGVLLDLLPRRRRTGLLEMIRGAGATGHDLVISALILSGVATVSGHALIGLGLVVGNWLSPTPSALGGFPPAMLAVWAGVLTSTLAFMSGVRDLRAATLSLMGLLMVWVAVFALAFGLADTWPWLAAVVPVGGALVACLGGLATGPSVAAAVVTVGTSGWLAHRVAVGFDREEHAGSQLDPALLRRARGDFSPEIALLTVIAVGGSALAQTAMTERPWPALIVSQVVFLLLPAAIVPLALGHRMSDLLPIGRPRLSAIVAAPGVAVAMGSAATLASAAVAAVYPTSSAVLDGYGDVLGAMMSGPGLLLIGLLPAVCEEALFRGAIQGLLLRRHRPAVAIAVQAVLFALFHVYPFKWAPTLVSGLVLGWLRWRTGSLVPGAIAHLTLNCTIAAAVVGGWSDALDARAAAIGLCAFALLWVYRDRSTNSDMG